MNNYLLNKLGEKFTRQELLKVVVKRGYSVSKAHSILEYELLAETIERTGRGKYRKINNKRAQVKDLHDEGYSYREIAEQLGISKSQVGNYLNGQSGHD